MPSTMQELLCLTRTNFQINSKQSFDDAKLYFGREQNKEIISDIELGYLAGYVPRIYLKGGYGTGKTHLLYHLKYHFEHPVGGKPQTILPFVIQVEAESRTRFQSLHKKMMDAVGIKQIEAAYRDYGFKLGPNRDTGFNELFEDSNVHQAMQVLQTGTIFKTIAWRWLTGEALTPGEQQGLGVTSSLAETGQLVGLLVTIGELFKRLGKNLLFLIDESESLWAVSNADAQRSWHDAFRRLADPNDNQSVGWILTFYTTMQDNPPSFMEEGDILTRLGRDGRRTLASLKPVEIKQFITDLSRVFIDKTCVMKRITAGTLHGSPDIYPYTKDGLDELIKQAEANSGAAIPRTILRTTTSCALLALRENKSAFDRDLVSRVAPAEFAAELDS